MEFKLLLKYPRGPIPDIREIDDMISKLTKLRTKFKTAKSVDAYNDYMYANCKDSILKGYNIPTVPLGIVNGVMRAIGEKEIIY